MGLSIKEITSKEVIVKPDIYNLFFHPGEVVELRVLKLFGYHNILGNKIYCKNVVSGYFNDGQKLLQYAHALDNTNPPPSGIYFTLNPLHSDVIARANNKVRSADSTTDKNDVKVVRWLPIDLDPIRTRGVSSSNDELSNALELQEEIVEWLKEEFEIEPGILAISGNGAHILVRIEDSDPDVASPVIKQALHAIAQKFPSEATRVDVDCSVFDPSRIWKFYGTTARKGDNTKERPHRKAVVFDTGVQSLNDIPVNEFEKVKMLADTYVEPENKKSFYINNNQSNIDINSNSGANIDLDRFLKDYGEKIGFHTVKEWKVVEGSYIYILRRCLFAEEHKTPDNGVDSGFIRFPNGKVIYQCFHDHCRGKRTIYDALKKAAGDDWEKYVIKKKKEPKIKTSEELINLVLSEVELFHTPNKREAFARIKVDDHFEVYPVNSSMFKEWVSMVYYYLKGKIPNSNSLSEAISTLEGFAKFKGEAREVFLRVAEDKENKKIYIDLANDNWEVIEVSTEGWKIISNPPVMFTRKKGMLPLPYPNKEKANINILKRYLNLESEDDFILITSWIVYAFKFGKGYPILALFASEGTGKSTTSTFLKLLIDPKEDDLKSLPANERDLAVTCANSWVSIFDNLSHVPDWLSDAFCRISTGGTIAVRKLYTDDEEEYFKLSRPMIINGITEVITRNDLADRSIAINLPYIPEDKRIDEVYLMEKYNNDLPYILGGVLNALSEGLRNIDKVKLSKLPRMANFAKWIVACEPALPWSEGGFLKAYNKNREYFVATSIETDSFIRPFLQWFENEKFFRGTVNELLEKLKKFHEDNYDVLHSKYFPKESRSLGKKLRRIQSVMIKAGIEISFKKSDGNRIIEIKKIEQTGETKKVETNNEENNNNLPESNLLESYLQYIEIDRSKNINECFNELNERIDEIKRINGDIVVGILVIENSNEHKPKYLSFSFENLEKVYNMANIKAYVFFDSI